VNSQSTLEPITTPSAPSTEPSTASTPRSSELDLLSLSQLEWIDYAKAQGWPRYRGEQIAAWIFTQKVAVPDAFKNIPKPIKEHLKSHFHVSLPKVVSRLDSEDGASKLLLQTDRGQLIESVILRYDNRVSLCVSSQVGCKMACSFCQTGKLGFMRNLSTHEILAQYVLAAQIVESEGRRLSHVVFMGMGEPLDNYENTKKACDLLIDPNGFGLSRKHVTLSTSGLSDKIDRLTSDDVRVALAVSLHAADDALRTDLMPINRKFPLASLKDSLRRFQEKTGDRLTIEYILIKDKNCEEKHAKSLVKFLEGLSAKVNLIPFNAHPGLPHERPTDEEIRSFQVYLSDRSIAAPVRYSKGLDVSGACGQLAAKTLSNLDLAPKRANLLSPTKSVLEPVLT
jgi:23S rRNA (adenine2503-C2)-methyltransferase